MNVAMVGVGTRGDLQPLVALAQRLERAGHRVRLIAHEYWSFLVEGTRIELYPLATGEPRESFAGSMAGRPRTIVGKALRLGSPSHTYADRAQVLEACRGSDLIVFSQMYWPAAHIAEYLGLPAAAAYFVPYFRTAAFPRPVGPLFLHRLRLGRAWNLLTHQIFEARNRRADLPWLNEWRRELGLMELSDPQQWAEDRRIPRLYGYSASFLPKPRDWPEWHHVTGYWFWEPSSWEPPAPLVEFLASDRPAVFVGFSSSIVEQGGIWESAILPGIRAAGCRAIIAPGWSETAFPSQPDVCVVEPLPFAWVFSRVAAVLHAAGAGTVGEVLRSGTPSVCLPMFGDQKFNAARLEALGLAPAPLEPRTLSAGRVAAAIRRALGDAGLRGRARAARERIMDEDGPARAVQLLEQALAGGARAGR